MHRHSSRKSAISFSQTVRLYTQTVPKLPPKTSLVSCWTTSKKKIDAEHTAFDVMSEHMEMDIDAPTGFDDDEL